METVPVTRHTDARMVYLPIDDIADYDYENPNSVHSPRGVGVVEDIICFPETSLGINCALCALQRYWFRDHQSRFVLSCQCSSANATAGVGVGRKVTIGLLYRL